MAMDRNLPRIGQNLRKIRQAQGYSLSRLSTLTGVSKAMLGQIERGESSPTLATLWKLTKGLHIPLTALIDLPQDGSARFDPVQSSAKQFRDAMQFFTVFPFDPVIGSETFLHIISSGQTHLSQPHSAGVVEDVFVLEGTIEILQTDIWHTVTAGSGLRFAADQPHGYRNISDQPARFHNVIHYPKA